jgi:glycosyltransferase involved in cell wall biosynthesis
MATAEINPQSQTPLAKSIACVPVSVIVPVRNEAGNLPRCLQSLRNFGEVYVVDSQSRDETSEIARSYGSKVVQFYYPGGWPKKRQWAMDHLPLAHEWILLLDADEVITPELENEMRAAVRDRRFNGYALTLQMHFLGSLLRHGDASFEKLSLFRRGKGKFECRLREQDASMCDMEVHEHIIVDGPVGKLRNPVLHHNVESLSRYIHKHDEYSNWESRVLLEQKSDSSAIPPRLFGSQAQRRRWLKQKFYGLPGSPALLFFYRYLFRLGFLDGVPGLIYCAFQGIQLFHTKAKIYELRRLAPHAEFRIFPTKPAKTSDRC